MLTKIDKYEISFFVFITFSYLYRSALPVLKYPFLVFYILFLCIILFKYRKKLINSLKDFLYYFYFPIIAFSILFIAFIFSDKIYLIVFKDIINSIILLSFFFILFILIDDITKLKCFISNYIIQAIVFAFIIAVVGLIDIFNVVNLGVLYSEFESEKVDYNFSLVPLFIGTLGIFYHLTYSSSKSKILLYNFFLLLFLLRIFLSGSRRGIILLAVIIAYIILCLIYSLFRSDTYLKTFIKNLKVYFVVILVSPFIGYLFIQFSYKTKNDIIRFLSAEKTFIAKKKISINVLRYVSIFNKEISFKQLDMKLWSKSFDPLEPGNGWGAGVFRTIYPLSGNDVGIVPSDAKGYLLDSSCIFGNSDHHAYSFTLIDSSSVSYGDYIKSSVFCYVSDDFNGDMVCLRSIGSVYGHSDSCYDLMKKGYWQKLDILANCKDGNISSYLYFNKQGVTDFSSLTGYVIFAYPEYSIITNEDTVMLNSNNILYYKNRKGNSDFNYINTL